jgi:hypothetical protein
MILEEDLETGFIGMWSGNMRNHLIFQAVEAALRLKRLGYQQVCTDR